MAPKDGDPTGVEASERMEFVMPRRNRVSAATQAPIARAMVCAQLTFISCAKSPKECEPCSL